MKNSLPILLIAIAVGLYFLSISPEYKKVNALQLERDGYDDILKKASELREIRAQLEAKVSKFSPEDLAKLEKMLPQNLDLAHLILEIDTIALKHGVIMHEITAEDKVKKEEPRPVNNETDTPAPALADTFETLSLSFGFNTSYKNVPAFLEELEKSLRVLDVVEVKVLSDQVDRSHQNYQMTIDTYWIK